VKYHHEGKSRRGIAHLATTHKASAGGYNQITQHNRVPHKTTDQEAVNAAISPNPYPFDYFLREYHCC
jgi:hypothetical protein